MTEIYEAIKRSAKRIKEAIEFDDTGYSENINATGDTQLKLDIKSDQIIEEEFAKVASIKEIISEEKEEKTSLHVNGIYDVGYDPLDGSSLIDVNLSVGSIFGIYEGGYAGANLKAAVYVVYGPRVELVIAEKDVKMYRMNKNGEFVFIKTIELKEKGKLNAPGSTQQCWEPKHKALIDAIFADGYRLRYSGGMVPDLHQILLKGGGLFSYPATSDVPKGKLRMIFEVFPFAFVYEKAGGEAIDGKQRILELSPSHPHDTTPCFFGSKVEIERVKQCYA
ncbi:class 1 fructose-bisphosphatase [Sulfurospirillum deleyianum]|uniref:Fructose-1,6-bisphosphatase class 1 n=1 Tax=Sulfurospirillum deleyianum (strain ATCC 51133 / DSM 6946 / 5175) TaxID=525898 RepID=D1B094_SULD5|nr:class 1 fructose-bisphosphatase [Sulfurospirillum deleyianum]ACZ11711.1 Fructose-bisphosphatase [Sulfurospirillum deleyianum DSM 6946]